MASQQAETAGHKGMTAAGMFWYIVGCISFGAAYFAKVPIKKAMADFGLVHLTGAETFWYYLGCVFFGANYFAKLPAAKALSELEQSRSAPGRQLEADSRPALPGQPPAAPGEDTAREQEPGT
jgi:hypothetical protein